MPSLKPALRLTRLSDLSKHKKKNVVVFGHGGYKA
uniref:Uncharacterized protein n=1 Tax=Anguilla anguilla TaxID=7936 RepID=A0A0E9UTW3_ANGAN